MVWFVWLVRSVKLFVAGCYMTVLWCMNTLRNCFYSWGCQTWPLIFARASFLSLLSRLSLIQTTCALITQIHLFFSCFSLLLFLCRSLVNVLRGHLHRCSYRVHLQITIWAALFYLIFLFQSWFCVWAAHFCFGIGWFRIVANLRLFIRNSLLI